MLLDLHGLPEFFDWAFKSICGIIKSMWKFLRKYKATQIVFHIPRIVVLLLMSPPACIAVLLFAADWPENFGNYINHTLWDRLFPEESVLQPAAPPSYGADLRNALEANINYRTGTGYVSAVNTTTGVVTITSDYFYNPPQYYFQMPEEQKAPLNKKYIPTFPEWLA